MSIYKPSLLDKFKDFVNGIKGNWNQYEDHVADFESHVAESASKHIHSSGENENGYWIQWEDGTMECYLGGPIILERSSTAFFQGEWVFPKPFPDRPYIKSVTFSLFNDTNSWDNSADRNKVSFCGFAQGASDNTKIALRVVPNESGFSGQWVNAYYLRAIGRWK